MTEDSRLKKQSYLVDKQNYLRKKKGKVRQINSLIDTPDERNINIVVEEHASSEKIHFDIVVDGEVGIASTFLNKSLNKLSLFRK